MNSSLTPTCQLGSPQRKLGIRQPAVTAIRHQLAQRSLNEGHAWIASTLHQLHLSVKSTPFSPARQPAVCSICRTPFASSYHQPRRAARWPMHGRTRPAMRCYSVSPALQTSTDGPGPPGGNGTNGGSGGGGGGDHGSARPEQHEAPVKDARPVQGLEDILLLDVQGPFLVSSMLRTPALSSAMSVLPRKIGCIASSAVQA